MLIHPTDPREKRKEFRKALKSGKLLQFPGAYNPLVAALVTQIGFDGIYVSGGVMANNRNLPDIGLTTMTEVLGSAAEIAKQSPLPTIFDADTGFGESMNMVRTIREAEYMGLAGCHIEDQVNPKRCGHLDNKTLVTKEKMVERVSSAARAKQDPNFLIIARTDARAKEGSGRRH